MDELFSRHERIAFQFSGGRDSLAALYLLRPYWARMTVYHLDTGDQFPEHREVVRRVAAELPDFRGIHGRLQDSLAAHGLPSDIIPTTHHTFVGQAVSGATFKVQDRYDCCFRALMAPMHERMVEDGITLIIRGQRDDEFDKPVTRSGFAEGGIEYFYPIQTWTADEVLRFLEEQGVEPAPFYRHGLTTTPDCMHCSAWWDEGRAAYLRQFHPNGYQLYRARLDMIRAALIPLAQTLTKELEE